MDACPAVSHIIRSLRGQLGIVLVAIDGPGGAGKSTLAKQLREALEATVVAIDDFYRVMPESDRFQLGPEDGYQQYFEWQRLRQHVLEPLRREELAKYECYDWQTNQLGATVKVEPVGVVIFDGVYSFRPELRAFYDYSIYVDAPREERVERLRDRGDSEEWISRWTAAEDWYRQRHRPQEAVDIIISGVRESPK